MYKRQDLLDELPCDEDVDGELQRIREDFAIDDLVALGFYVRVLGGRWTALHRGVVADGVSALARSGLPKDFCEICNVPKQSSFYLSKFGEEGARMMASEVARRGDCFFLYCMA